MAMQVNDCTRTSVQSSSICLSLCERPHLEENKEQVLPEKEVLFW